MNIRVLDTIASLGGIASSLACLYFGIQAQEGPAKIAFAFILFFCVMKLAVYFAQNRE